MKSDVPDRFQIEGILPSHADAPISISYRHLPPFKGTPGLIWAIQGSKGEIRVEADAVSITIWDQNTEVLVEDYETGEVESVSWVDGMAERGFQGAARNVGGLYEAFAGAEKSAWPSFEDALERHRFLEEVWGDWH